MRRAKPILAWAMAYSMALPGAFGASHREAPITALDRAADITDYFAFVSYDDPSKVTFILNVDPLLDPANGPNYFPFDPDILYAIRIDNNYDAVEDITFEFRFQTEIRAPGVFTGFVGAGAGISAPPNAPGGAKGLVIPPAITALDGTGSEGLSLRQTYTVSMVEGTGEGATRTNLGEGKMLFAVPSNVGPRTMPDYPSLAKKGIFSLGNGVRVFAGTADDPFYIDLGAVFDSLNLRNQAFFTGVPGALSQIQDLTDWSNFAPDTVAGYNVNTIAIEVPISMIASNSSATIGSWGTTSRPQMTIRRSPDPATSEGDFRQVQRMGNPLINEVIIGTGNKDAWSISEPKDDAEYAPFALDPLLARVLNAVYGFAVPNPPRTDLLPLVTYAPPIAAAGTPAGPVADLLRLNLGVPPTPAASRKRLGLLAGDAAGFPNGRRVSDDVTDISLRAVAGILAGGSFGKVRLGDGVNMNDVPYQETFPYVAFAQSGRNSVKSSPGMPTCGPARNRPCAVD